MKKYNEHDTFVLDESIEFYEDCPMCVYCKDIDHVHFQSKNPCCTVEMTNENEHGSDFYYKDSQSNYIKFNLADFYKKGDPLKPLGNPPDFDGYIYVQNSEDNYIPVGHYRFKIIVDGKVKIYTTITVTYNDTNYHEITGVGYEKDNDYVIIETAGVNIRNQCILRFKVKDIKGNTEITFMEL